MPRALSADWETPPDYSDFNNISYRKPINKQIRIAEICIVITLLYYLYQAYATNPVNTYE